MPSRHHSTLPKRRRLKVKRAKPQRKRLWLRSRDYWLGWGCLAAAIPCIVVGISHHWFLAPGGLLAVAAILAHRRHAKRFRSGLGLW